MRPWQPSGPIAAVPRTRAVWQHLVGPMAKPFIIFREQVNCVVGPVNSVAFLLDNSWLPVGQNGFSVEHF